MNTLFIILFLLSIVGFMGGLIQPKWVRMQSRKRAALVYGCSTALFFILFGVTLQPTPASNTVSNPSPVNSEVIKGDAQPTDTPKISAPSAAQAQTPVASGNMKAPAALSASVSATLTASTNYYVNLFAHGKALLGSTQYSSASAGLVALSDPNSSANHISAFRNSNCLQSVLTANADAAYRKASDTYYNYDPNLDTSAIDDWNYDIYSVSSAICTWANDAVSWEVQDASTETLSADEADIAKNIALVRADIARLK